MFCPNCRLEYRPGFHECSDCGVLLVDKLPEVVDPSIPRDSAGRELAWSGISGPTYRAITKIMDARGIAHTDVEKTFGFTNTAQTATLIWIAAHDRAAAQKAVADAIEEGGAPEPASEDVAHDSSWVNPFGFGRRVINRVPNEPGDDSATADTLAANTVSEIEESNDGSDDEPPNDVVEDFDPDDATAQVWSGADENLADTLEDCLNNVGIGCVVAQDGDSLMLSVCPGSEKRAREIIREILGASAPE